MSENATPRFNSNGFRDDTNANVSVNTQIPAHLPVIPLLTQKGPSELTIIPADKVTAWYGMTSFEDTSAYYTHQTALATKIITAGNNVAIKRILPPTAKKSLIRLAVELAPCELLDYARNSDGSIRTQRVNGIETPVTGSIFNGTKVIWHTNRGTTMQHAFGQAVRVGEYRRGNLNSVSQGYLSQYTKSGSSTFGQTILLPIMDIEITDEGKWGDDIGLIIEELATRETSGAERDLVTNLKSFLFKFKIVQRTRMGYNIQPTFDNDLFIKASLLDTDVHPTTRKSLFVEEVMQESYNEPDNNNGNLGARSPFGRVHVYSENYKEALDRLVNGYVYDGVEFKGEKHFKDIANEYGRSLDYSDPDNTTLLNFLTGVDVDSVPFHAFSLKGNSVYGGVEFNSSLPLYGQGGDDGIIYNTDGTPDNLATLQLFDDGVKAYVHELSSGEYNFRDMARFPVSALWDSGFSLETKKGFIRLMGVRKDITVFLTTFIQADYSGTPIITPPDPVRPAISCAGGQMDVIFEIEENRLYSLEIDGRMVAQNVSITQLRVTLQSYGISSGFYEVVTDAQGETN